MLSSFRAPPAPLTRAPPPASAAAARRNPGTRSYAASTQQGRDRQATGSEKNHWGATNGNSSSQWSGSGAAGGGSNSSSSSGSSSPDPLLRSIAQSSTARELHQLLLRHSGELGGREVAAALEVAAKRRLLQAPPPAPAGGNVGAAPNRSSSSSSTGRDGALAPLLVQLADKYAAVMPPACLSASAWSLAALQLAPARPVMQRMHALAEQQLCRYSPSQLCALLWAGGSLDPGSHSPLFSALAGLIRGGMSLTLFGSHDLAALAWLCGREGGTAARDVSIAVAEECRVRLQTFAQAREAASGDGAASRARQRKASASSSSSSSSRSSRGDASSSNGGSSCTSSADSDRNDGSSTEGGSSDGGGVLPPPPFTIADAAMLLSGLAQQQLRVGGVVEPLLRQCEPQTEQAEANDVARIIIALGELMMEIAPEPMSLLLARLCEVEALLSPQQVASSLWACLRLGGKFTRKAGSAMASMAIRHYTRHRASYRTVDTIGLVWGVTHLQRAMPEEALMGALEAVQPELPQCSTAGLTNLVLSLGKNAELRCKTRPRWLDHPAGLAAVQAAELAVAELARRAHSMQPADLASVASALAMHPPLAACLRPRDIAALRDACAAAAAANDLLSFDVAQLANAAARLRWTDRGFLDALAHAIQLRINLALTTSEVFSQSVWALASLAPSRYGDLFASLASAYASKMQHPERLPAHIAGFQAEERSNILAAFATVARAQGLPRSTTLDLLASVLPMELRQLPISDAVPLLQLAAEARLPSDAPVVQSCCKTIQRSYPRLSPESLRQVHAALGRCLPGGDPTLAAVERHLCLLERQGGEAGQHCPV